MSWEGGTCVVGGMYGSGCAWWGDIHGGGGMFGRGMHGRYYDIQSMSRWYASYWNAFLFYTFFLFSDTIAFHTVLTSYDTISTGSAVEFNEVLLNEGDG